MQFQKVTKYARWFTLLLLVATHVVARTVFAGAMEEYVNFLFWLTVQESVHLCQLGLVLAALILSSGMGRLRWRVFAAVAILLGCILRATFDNNLRGRASLQRDLELLHAAGVACTAFALAVRGYRFGYTPIVRQQTFQLSLKSILLQMGLVCVVVAIAAGVRERNWAQTGPMVLLLFAVISVAITSLGIWLVPRVDPDGIGAVVTILVAALLGCVPAYVFRQDADSLRIVGWMVTHAVIVCGTLTVLRACGYRLTKLAPVGAASVSQPALALSGGK